MTDNLWSGIQEVLKVKIVWSLLIYKSFKWEVMIWFYRIICREFFCTRFVQIMYMYHTVRKSRNIRGQNRSPIFWYVVLIMHNILRTYVRLLAAAWGLKKPISGNWLALTFYTRILSWILEYLSLSICYCLQFSKGNRDTTTEQETKVYTIHQIQN